MSNRREFISLLGGAVVVADCRPRAAAAWSDHIRPHRSSAVAA
jgi:hypothetical protein